MERFYVSTREESIKRIADAVGFNGPDATLQSAESVTLSNGYWDGGFRTFWHAVDLQTGKASRAGGAAVTNAPQFGGAPSAPIVEIPAGVAIVSVTIGGSGRTSGRMTIHARPDSLTPLLPGTHDDLSESEQIVLCCTQCFKSSYQGRPLRRDMAAKLGVSSEAFDQASESLKARKLLNKAGAITPDGRNAANASPLMKRVRFA